MHKEFFNQLSNIATVKVVAKLKNDRIGFPSADDIRIFIPDLHMFSKSRQEKYNYECHTNYNEDASDLLPKFVNFLLKFKTENQDKKVVVYQVGDFLDPWRETSKPWKTNPVELSQVTQHIIESNKDVYDVLVDDALNTQFVLGNHDFDLHRDPNLFAKWRFLRFYITDDTDTPIGGVFHGDLFSWVERICPDWIKQFFVYNFSPKDSEKKIKKRVQKQIRKTHPKHPFTEKYKEVRSQIEPSVFGELASSPDQIGDEWNVKREGDASKGDLRYLKESKRCFLEVNETENYKLRIAFIGHTHNARIAVDDGGDDFFALVDCGGWIKKYKGKVMEGGTEKVISEKNAQVGVLSENEARIYQLSPK